MVSKLDVTRPIYPGWRIHEQLNMECGSGLYIGNYRLNWDTGSGQLSLVLKKPDQMCLSLTLRIILIMDLPHITVSYAI